MALQPDFGLTRAAQWLMRKLVTVWVRATVAPEDIAGRLAGRARPVCYVLEHDSLSDFLTLQTCASRGRCHARRAGSTSAR